MYIKKIKIWRKKIYDCIQSFLTASTRSILAPCFRNVKNINLSFLIFMQTVVCDRMCVWEIVKERESERKI